MRFQVSPFAFFTIVVVASNKLPVNSLAELIAYAKAHPGELNYGSVGIGSSQHLGGVYFEQVTGVKLTHVPYRNIAQYTPDMIAGAVPLGFQWLPNVAAALQSGGAKALAVAAKQRMAALPDVPTTAEAGLPEYESSGWFMMLAPSSWRAPARLRARPPHLLNTYKSCSTRTADKSSIRSTGWRTSTIAPSSALPAAFMPWMSSFHPDWSATSSARVSAAMRSSDWCPSCTSILVRGPT